MILPQVLFVDSLGQDSSYFQSGAIRKLVDWQGDREAFVRGRETYYEIFDNIYMTANLYTSNAGAVDVDTVFDSFDQTNYLYFDNVKLLNAIDGEEVFDLTKNFKIMSNSEYTILNTNGVAEISLTGKKFTKTNDSLVFEDIDEDK